MVKYLLFALTAIFSISLAAQPVVTSNPQGQNNCINECVDLRVSAVGNGLIFQWQADSGSGFVNIATAMDDSIEVCHNGESAPSSMDYRCVVTDGNGASVTSLTATVTLDSCLAPIASFTYEFTDLEACFTSTSTNAETLIWNFGNSKTNTNNTATPCSDYDEAWYYDVALYAFNDYGSDSVQMTISLVGLNEIETGVKIYPNPASDFIMIDAERAITNVSLYDIKGVRTQNVAVVNGVVSLDNIAAGVYVLEVSMDDKSIRERIIIQ